jgi:hypothetical protein
MRAAALAFVLCGIGGAALADTAWCPDLKRVTDLSATGTLGHVAGAAREGSFRATTLPLAGWRDCSLYGARTYTCDSASFTTAGDAERALAALVAEVTACLGQGWGRDDGRSSPVYVVVRSEHDPVSMTLSTDQADDGRHVVRLTLFARGR